MDGTWLLIGYQCVQLTHSTLPSDSPNPVILAPSSEYVQLMHVIHVISGEKFFAKLVGTALFLLPCLAHAGHIGTDRSLLTGHDAQLSQQITANLSHTLSQRHENTYYTDWRPLLDNSVTQK